MNTMKHSIPNAVCATLICVILLFFSLFGAALIWSNWVSGKMYICTDSMGFFDFIPPFVHGGGDVYLVPAWRVWFVWWILMAAAFALPALIVWNVWRKQSKYGGDSDTA